jgi:hypothetical protein
MMQQDQPLTAGKQLLGFAASGNTNLVLALIPTTMSWKKKK